MVNFSEQKTFFGSWCLFHILGGLKKNTNNILSISFQSDVVYDFEIAN